MRLINLDDILKQFPEADFDGDDLENMKAYPHWKTDITGLFNILKSVPIIEACEDCISREEALKHTHIEYDDDGIGHRVVYAEDIEELPSVTPAISKMEQVEDCISREAVVRLVEQHPNIIGNRYSGLIANIKHLPPVTPQPKTGK